MFREVVRRRDLRRHRRWPVMARQLRPGRRSMIPDLLHKSPRPLSRLGHRIIPSPLHLRIQHIFLSVVVMPSSSLTISVISWDTYVCRSW